MVSEQIFDAISKHKNLQLDFKYTVGFGLLLWEILMK